MQGVNDSNAIRHQAKENSRAAPYSISNQTTRPYGCSVPHLLHGKYLLLLCAIASNVHLILSVCSSLLEASSLFQSAGTINAGAEGPPVTVKPAQSFKISFAETTTALRATPYLCP